MTNLKASEHVCKSISFGKVYDVQILLKGMHAVSNATDENGGIARFV